MTKAKRSSPQYGIAKTSSRAIVITKYDIMGVIHLSQREASQVLRICLSTLKKRFYRLFDERWPSSSKRRDLMDKTPEERLREWNNKKKKVHYLLNEESMDEKYLMPFEFPQIQPRIIRSTTEKKRSQPKSYDHYYTPSPTSVSSSHFNSRQESFVPLHMTNQGTTVVHRQQLSPPAATIHHMSPNQRSIPRPRLSPIQSTTAGYNPQRRYEERKVNALMPRPLIPHNNKSSRYTPYLPPQSFKKIHVQGDHSRRAEQPQH